MMGRMIEYYDCESAFFNSEYLQLTQTLEKRIINFQSSIINRFYPYRIRESGHRTVRIADFQPYISGTIYPDR